MNKKFTFLIFVLSLIGICNINGQVNDSRIKWNINDFGSQRVFVENKGQFQLNGTDKDILYALDESGSKIFFTKQGLTYSFIKSPRKNKDADSKEEDKDEIEPAAVTDFVNMLWLGSNPNVEVVAEQHRTDYYNYTVKMEDGSLKNFNHVDAYEKIVYRNLYPGIDVEYVIHPDKGIEYSLILHPGADVSLVKMRYSNGHSLAISNGNVHISTVFGDIIDNAPSAFYNSDKSRIVTSFKNNGNIVSFEMGAYDNTKTVTVDPWTISPAFPNSNEVWNVKTDGSGNVYLWGGDSPFELKQYTSAGSLVWTYSSPWSSANYWTGTLITDKAGNSYVTAGSTGEIAKVSPAGSQVWSNNPGGAGTYEYWSETFNCDQTQIIVGGTNLPSGYVFNINVSNGSIANFVKVGYKDGINPDEGRSVCSAPNGNYYFLTLDSIGSVNSGVTTVNSKTNNSYNFAYAGPYYARYSGSSGNIGFNAIRATKNYVYTVNGANVAKRNIGSLAIISTAAIPGGGLSSSLGSNQPENNGIDIDSCGNVYVGGIKEVTEFDANLNKISTVTVSDTVYDVAVNNNGEVIACGHNFAQSINFSACKPPAPICKPCTNPTVSKTTHLNVLCNGGTTGAATVSGGGGSGPYFYSWSSISDTTGTANNLGAGVYTITVTNSGGCSVTDTIIITQPSAVTAALTAAPACSGNNGTATAVASGGTGPYTYSWSPSGGTNATATGLAAGTYTVTIKDKNGCTTTQSAIIGSASGSGPTVTPSETNASCSTCNGSATASASGSTPPYAYSWSNGGTTSSISSLCAGSYTVTVTPSSGTTTSNFYTENFTGGALGGWTLNIPGTGTPGTNPNKWVVDNNTPLCNPSGYYLHIACSGTNTYYTCNPGATYDPGSPFDNSATDLYASSPNISTVGESGMTLGFTYESDGNSSKDYGLVSFSSNGGSTWNDQPTKYSGVSTCTKASVAIPATYNGISNFRVAFRWINVGKGKGGNDPPFAIDSIYISGTSAATGCPTVQTIVVGSGGGSAFTLSTTPTNASCGSSNGSATVNPSPVGTYTYKWSNGQTTQTATGLAAGTYTVIVSNSGGCAPDTAKVTIGNTGGPSVNFTRADPKCNGNNGTATANASGGSSPYTYAWNNGLTASSINVGAGSYTCTVTDKNGCQSVDTIILTQPPVISASLSGTTSASCGTANGSATVTASGGTGALTYSWSAPGGTNATLSNVAAGTYTCTVTDANGCTQTVTASVSNTGGPSVNMTATSPKCNGGTGIAVAAVSGGASPYTYSWSPTGGSKDTASGLISGIYTCMVTDKNGCVTSDTVKVTQPGAITGGTTITNASCGNSDGSISLLASGGTGALSYSWSPSGATTNTLGNLAAGSYTCTVTDGNGCIKQITALVSNVGAPTVAISQSNEKCFGDNIGTALANVSGGSSPYTYSWSNSATTSSITGLVAGTYTCVVTDNKGCITNDTVKITQPPALTSTIKGTAASCGKLGSATVTPAGGTSPYTYNWSPSGGTNATAANLKSGSYTCTVTDADSCKQVLPVTVTGNSGPAVSISSDTTIKAGGLATIFATGGGTYLWSPPTGLSCSTCGVTTADPTKTTTYCVLVTDTSGCADSACMVVNVEQPCGKIFVPDAFSPNGDRENDLECVYGNCIETISFRIFDRWGNEVFETNDPNQNCWDGKYKGQLMNSAVFVYYLDAVLTNGDKVSQKGNITLVR
jgi:gliding motility-associated-like protein